MLRNVGIRLPSDGALYPRRHPRIQGWENIKTRLYWMLFGELPVEIIGDQVVPSFSYRDYERPRDQAPLWLLHRIVD
jgi:hypothetical protein